MAGKIETGDLANEVVPAGARMNRGALTMAYWSLCSAMFYIFLSAALAVGYGAVNALIGMALSIPVFALINAAFVRFSIRTGLSATLLSRRLFGDRGASLATLLLFVTAMYYAVFEGSVLAVAASKVFPALDYGTACLIIAAYSAPLVIGSVQRFLDKLNAILLPVYAIGLVLLVALTGQRYGWSLRWLDVGAAHASAGGWWYCFVAYMGNWILAMITMDFARFGKPADMRYHALFSFGVPFYLVAFAVNGVVGIFLVGTVDLVHVTETAVVDASLAVLGAGIGLPFLWATQTRINTANYYVSTLNMGAFAQTAFGLRWPKWAWAGIVGVVVLVLMRSTDIFGYMLIALNYQAIFITAWVGVALAYILRARANHDDPHPGAGSHAGALPAWLAASAAGLVVSQLQAPVGSFAVPLSIGLAFAFECMIARREASARMAAARDA
ncbi:purine-cytosine permease family protein [Paraburkholderia oxyphila]|uniref:purine-cytosine permease family protein n=1 Tax=Paraburkholderia oxyphila TaxID=614212 RepID=UPI001C3F3D01|nr:allantoin permease [Paraburkholderia oxyphila]